MSSKGLADRPGYARSNHPELSALRINGLKQFLGIVSHAIRANRGVLAYAAKALKVNRETLRTWVDHYPVLRRTLEDAREKAKLETGGGA